MKIGIFADTHLPKKGTELPLPLRNGLAGVDLILHADDWSTLEVAEQLQSPTDKRRQPQFSYGIMDIGEQIALQHHFFAKEQESINVEKRDF